VIDAVAAKTELKEPVNFVQHILIFGVRVYRWVISPAKAALFGPLGRCRYSPSCSEYGLEAIRVHGAARGSWLAVRRICRCHPWGGCGDDPVPETKAEGRGQKVERTRAPLATALSDRGG